MKIKNNIKAFTLVELLVVLAIISLLMTIVIPCLGKAQSQCRTTICKSNMRQLYIANIGYSNSNNDYYVLAAKDIYNDSGGKHRWHGVRQSSIPNSDPEVNTFKPEKGPLSSFLNDGKIKECPTTVRYEKEDTTDAFEAGCGGYGYNYVGIGTRTYQYGSIDPRSAQYSMKSSELQDPHKKVMFTDTAYVKSGKLIEYSFCTAPKAVVDFGRGIEEKGKMRPSIHFRHCGKTNVIWCDGHVTSEAIDFPENKRYGTVDFRIGWFGPHDNSLFRPKRSF